MTTMRCRSPVPAEPQVRSRVREVKAPFRPDQLTAEFSALFKQCRVREVRSDRFGAEWVTEAFRMMVRRPTRSTLLPYTSLFRSLHDDVAVSVVLLDTDRVTSQLVNLERRSGRSGRDSIRHPPGLHDDDAVSFSGACRAASALACPRGESTVPARPAHRRIFGAVQAVPRARGSLGSVRGRMGDRSLSNDGPAANEIYALALHVALPIPA